MSPLSDRNRALLASRGRGGLTLARDDVRRVQAARQRPSYSQPPKQAAPESTPADAILSKMWKANGGQPESMKPQEDGGGLAQKFFGTTLGKGLGVALNNPIVKSVLKPLDVLAVPSRAIYSTINEVGDLFSGEGFSPNDWIDQVNPDAWLDGNQEGSIGMGDVWQKHGKALGAGDNEWLDAAVGFAGDVALDPLTYVGGLGIATKGLGGLRAGTRLGAAVAKGADAATEVNRLRGLTDDAIKAARKTNASKGSRSNLAGRQIRTKRVSEAQELLTRADPALLDELYGGTNLAEKAMVEVQHRAGRGLGAMQSTDKAVNELVETALNIKPPSARFRVPFTRTMGAALPGSGRPAQALQNAMGKARLGINETRLGAASIDATSPLNVENANRILTRGSKADPEEFAQAARLVVGDEAARTISGEFNVLSQNMKRGQEKAMNAEISDAGSKAAYLHKAETEGGTILNELYDQARVNAERFGVTIPELSTGKYVTHAFAPEFRRFMADQKNEVFADDWIKRLGGNRKQDLTEESGRMMSRDIGPNQDLPVPGKPGVFFNTGDGTISQINANARAAGYKYRILEDTPGKLFDDYAQVVADDVGRRGARAEAIAKGSPDMRYDTGLSPQIQGELVEEQRKAAERVGNVDFNEDAVRAQLASQQRVAADNVNPQLLSTPQEVVRSPRYTEADGVTPQPVARYADGKMKPHVDAKTQTKLIDLSPARDGRGMLKPRADSKVRKLQDLRVRPVGDLPEQGGLSFTELDRMNRTMGDRRNLQNLVQKEFEKWVQIGTNEAVMMNPAVDAMLKNFMKEISNPGPLMKTYRALNRYFKNFAVLTPGFHVRNGLSAIFMNIADGVPMLTTNKGVAAWKRFSKASKDGTDMQAGMKYIDNLLAGSADEVAEAQALRAVMGSGAGGRFTEAGIAEGLGSKVSGKIMENALTRKSQDAGAFVEGAVRMGMAMDTIQNGGSAAEAMSRITRIHFDYSQTSRFDDKAKQVAPFWSFMSRNIPMQVAQQWGRPQAYLAYEKLKNNMPSTGEFEEGEVPRYIEDGGGFALNLGPFGNWLEPDLPHTRVGEDVERYANVLSDPLGATSGLSPVITAPLEYAFGQDAFTGQKFGPDDWTEVSWANPVDWLPMASGVLAGQIQQGDDGQVYVKTELANAVEAMEPLSGRYNRIAGSGTRETARKWESAFRLFGLPVRNITPKQVESARLGAQFDQGDIDSMLRATGQAG